MDKTRSYKDLIVFQKALVLTREVVEYFSKFQLPKSKEFAVIQVLRAVASIGANIAEGYGRLYGKSYRQFLAIARGSSYEVDYWLTIIAYFPDFDKQELVKFQAVNTEISKMLTAIMKKLQKASSP